MDISIPTACEHRRLLALATRSGPPIPGWIYRVSLCVHASQPRLYKHLSLDTTKEIVAECSCELYTRVHLKGRTSLPAH